ncbi:MAG: 2'-5' RNA ligase family protein [Planctomycetaceae bacterium]
MAAIAAPLDAAHSEKVSELWRLLGSEVGLKRAADISPVPHFSFHCARDFDLETLGDIVQQMAGAARPLRVRTAGIGVFTGVSPVVYIPVVRTPELTRLQLALWSAAAVASEEPLAQYHPASWIPHITLAQGDVTAASLTAAIDLLNSHDLVWDLTVDSLVIIRGRGDRPQELTARHVFGGGSARNF